MATTVRTGSIHVCVCVYVCVCVCVSCMRAHFLYTCTHECSAGRARTRHTHSLSHSHPLAFSPSLSPVVHPVTARHLVEVLQAPSASSPGIASWPILGLPALGMTPPPPPPHCPLPSLPQLPPPQVRAGKDSLAPTHARGYAEYNIYIYIHVCVCVCVCVRVLRRGRFLGTISWAWTHVI